LHAEYNTLYISFTLARVHTHTHTHTHTHARTHTHTTVLRPSWYFPGLPGWAGTRKVKPIGIYWIKR